MNSHKLFTRIKKDIMYSSACNAYCTYSNGMYDPIKLKKLAFHGHNVYKKSDWQPLPENRTFFKIFSSYIVLD